NVFSERELGLYAAIVPGDRTRAFFRSWVAKEAYLKATGDGLAGGLQSLETEPIADASIRPIAIGGDAGALRSWWFEGFDVSGGIVGAVAVDAGGAAIDFRLRRIDPELPARADP
ncbi:MAG: 4'-phosphopantetheinyl transferase superfamily protein, partial [Hyphomicrobium sp.]|nr:4'-phosphopantetheinyl transferase superfamily protein [Hyphomicrobium sp.]